MGTVSLLFASSFVFSILINSATSTIIYHSQSIRDGDTAVSTGGSFELGFFSPGSSAKRYLGIWYKKSPRTVLWVANREVPVSDSSGALNLSSKGILVLYSSTNDIVWPFNSSRTAENPVAALLESGNLVVREENDRNPENFLWQSFDHPCDTLMLGMKLGSNFVTKIDKFLSSWRSAEDPARGEYSLVIDTHGYPQLLLKRGNITLFRAGSWNGIKFVSNSRSVSISNEFVLNSQEVYYRFGIQTPVHSRLTLSPSGDLQSNTWNDRTNDWVLTDAGQYDQSENYASCGSNTLCEMSRSPICACLDGFVPKSTADWNVSDLSDGCIRRTPLECSDKVGFLKYTGMKLPDTSSSWYDKSISLKECEGLCLKNCSCTAPANLDVRDGGSGCLIWFGDLIDTRRSTGDGQDLYVRMNATELGVLTKKWTFSKKKLAGIVSSAIVSGMGMLMFGFIFSMRKRNLRKKKYRKARQEDMELPVFDMSTITYATNTFSDSNKLGEGGFGPVYKGILTGGQQIAVKRLSKSSGQGLHKFKNKVMLIAKLQHRNLVKLLGCCIHEDEIILIYEYMPNKSLDSFIFDQTRRKLLDWSKRINIIGGGLLYLHQDSRLRIIHRDIKASNILVDEELNPKLSDFGLARMFGGDQTEAKTNRVVGTYGYMSPKYASNGHFSVKSDAFSFGVLDLKIVSGKKNRGFHKINIKLSSMGRFFVILVCCFLLFTLTNSSTPAMINPSQSIRDGETLLSDGGSFELGFFNPGNSTNRYLGLWHTKSPKTVLWVANRDTPFSDRLGVLTITREGVLVLLRSPNDTVWSSNPSRTAENPVAELLESGNLVVREENDSNPENILWQSFDHPCDTLMLGMKLGSNFVTKMDRFLSSWRSAEDPARGEYSLVIDTHGYPQLLLKRGNKTLIRGGSWNGINFVSGPRPLPISNEFVFNSKEVYFKFEIQSSLRGRLTLSPSGLLQGYTRTNDWVITDADQPDRCDDYAICGPNTRCEINRSPICVCLDGFVPKSLADWNFSDWSGGCIRRTPLECSDKVGFLKYTGMKLPDTSSSWYDKSISLKECGGLCLKNCSCTAYANLDVRDGGSGCLIWFGDLIDTRRSTGDGQDLYVRMNATELAMLKRKRTFSKKKLAGIVSSAIVSGIGMLLLGFIFSKRKRNLRKKTHREARQEDMELPVFDMSTIAHATDTFSDSNKLGEGGFGPVYKGILIGGQQIAVKRLSKSSGQGLVEFKNEVMLIAKLQHRNLVKLLGCSVHEDERMLIYEYMPNKSLDFFIFDQTRRKLLDWSKRINIVGGIARGLLYLHQDSRLRIIHRDIKPSNILVDEELNPKISDFGLARMFGGDQTEAKTNRVVGTYGYMSPEYASNGHFSVKSDAFSFGVLVLEIVSGKKNRGFRHLDPNLNLLGHAWMLWIKGTPFELIDECLAESSNLSDIIRCIHVALLCVQQRPEDRPNMSAVVLILGSEIPLPQPKQPGFFMGENPHEQRTSSNKHVTYSGDEVSLMSLEAR